MMRFVFGFFFRIYGSALSPNTSTPVLSCSFLSERKYSQVILSKKLFSSFSQKEMDISKYFKTELFLVKQVYFSGETIKGQVVVFNLSNEAKPLRERISVTFNGYTKTNLAGRMLTANTPRPSAITAGDQGKSTGQEVHLQSRIFLTPEDYASVQLVPRQNAFPFEFQLPSFLPSTFFSHLGAVYYEAVTSFLVGIPYNFVRCDSKATFRVISSQDLNLHSLAGLSSYFSFEKTLPKAIRCGDREKEYGVKVITTNIQLPAQGYIPGEYINLAIEIIYTDEFFIQILFVQLINETTYVCPSGSLTEAEVVLGSSVTFRKKREKQIQVTARLQIPSQLLPSTPANSATLTLISTKYFVKIKAQLPTGLLTIATVPVIIGTIPLREIQQRTNSVRSTSGRQRPAILGGEGAVGGIIPTAPSLPEVLSDDDDSDIPPSYLEAVSMTSGSSPVPSEFNAENN